MTTFTEEFESIREAIYHKPKDDPGRLEACLSYALEALREIGSDQRECICSFRDDLACTGCHGPTEPQLAQAALRRMEMRVRLGDDIRPGMEQSFGEMPYERVLSDGDGDLG